MSQLNQHHDYPKDGNGTFPSAAWSSFFSDSGLNQTCAQYYTKLFEEHDMELDMIPDLTHEVLVQIGVLKAGHRIKIIRMKENVWEPPGKWNVSTSMGDQPHTVAVPIEPREISDDADYDLSSSTSSVTYDSPSDTPHEVPTSSDHARARSEPGVGRGSELELPRNANEHHHSRNRSSRSEKNELGKLPLALSASEPEVKPRTSNSKGTTSGGAAPAKPAQLATVSRVTKPASPPAVISVPKRQQSTPIKLKTPKKIPGESGTSTASQSSTNASGQPISSSPTQPPIIPNSLTGPTTGGIGTVTQVPSRSNSGGSAQTSISGTPPSTTPAPATSTTPPLSASGGPTSLVLQGNDSGGPEGHDPEKLERDGIYFYINVDEAKYKLNVKGAISVGEFRQLVTQSAYKSKLNEEWAVFCPSPTDGKLLIVKEHQLLSSENTYFIIFNSLVQQLSKKLEKRIKKELETRNPEGKPVYSSDNHPIQVEN